MVWLYGIGCLMLGMGLGANELANVFGMAVHTRTISLRWAMGSMILSVMAGAMLQGQYGMARLSVFSTNHGVVLPVEAGMIMAVAGVLVLGMTLVGTPISASQAVIGSVLGFGIAMQYSDVQATMRYVGAWFGTPLLGCFFGYLVMIIHDRWARHSFRHFRFYDRFTVWTLWGAGVLAAYTLGANNVANVTGVLFGHIQGMSLTLALLAGALGIGCGVLLLGKVSVIRFERTMLDLTPTTAMLCLLSGALTVQTFSFMGIPVSLSQGILGGLFGVTLHRKIQVVQPTQVRKILLSWTLTPSVSLLLTFLLAKGLFGQ